MNSFPYAFFSCMRQLGLICHFIDIFRAKKNNQIKQFINLAKLELIIKPFKNTVYNVICH